MAFSFTLAELRAELRALGHDGLPDRLILSFLSELHLPPSSPPPSDTSGYDTEASISSTHSLSCGYGSSKDCSLGARDPEVCVDGSSFSRKASSELGHGGPDDNASCLKSSSLQNRNSTADFGDGTACGLGEGCFGDGKTMERKCSLKRRAKLAGSRMSAEQEEVLNRWDDSEVSLNLKTVAEGVDLACCDLSEIRSSSPGVAWKTGSTLRRLHHGKGGEDGREGNTQNIIEHFWISVGEEHMRAMHRKISKEKEQLKESSVSKLHGDVECKEALNGCESLIAKVQQCENDLQCLNLSLQAERCNKPWFFNGARKPRISSKEKRDLCSKRTSSNLLPASDSAVPIVAGGEKCSIAGGKSSIVTGMNSEIMGNAHDKTSARNQCLSSLEDANECMEVQSKISTMAENQSQRINLSKVEEGNTAEATLAVILSVGDGGEAHQTEDMSDKVHADIAPEKINDPNHSVCSKSSSASYQHSKSSEDSGSNGSQQLSVRWSSRRQKQHRKRGGKIDRVARFAEMQRLWKKDTFLAANEAGGKRKGVQSFHHLFSSLHSSST